METKSGDTHLPHEGWPNGRWFQRPEIGWKILEPFENRDSLDGLEEEEEARSRWVFPFLHSGPPTLSGTLRPTCLGAKRAPKVLH